MSRRSSLRSFESFTKAEIKKVLLAYDCAGEDCSVKAMLTSRYQINMATLKRFIAMGDSLFEVPGPWRGTHLGKQWSDMPGADLFTKRCNFALWRRGKNVFLDAKAKAIEAARVKRAKRKPRGSVDVAECEIDGLAESGSFSGQDDVNSLTYSLRFRD